MKPQERGGAECGLQGGLVPTLCKFQNRAVRRRPRLVYWRVASNVMGGGELRKLEMHPWVATAPCRLAAKATSYFSSGQAQTRKPRTRETGLARVACTGPFMQAV